MTYFLKSIFLTAMVRIDYGWKEKRELLESFSNLAKR